jgi:hypothetical protein
VLGGLDDLRTVVQVVRNHSLCLVVPTVGSSKKTSTAGSLEGVWKIVEMVTTGANASTITTPQPSLVIFTKGHYSFLYVHGAQPRPQFAPAKDPDNLTDAEKIARYEQWSRFTANAGTYEVKGSTLTRRPLVAKNETVMAKNSSLANEVKLEGNTLWLIEKSEAGQPASETRARLKRVE